MVCSAHAMAFVFALRSHAALLESENPGNVFWATDKGYELADTSDATVSLLEKAES